jgi:aminopeptidase N
VHETAHQWFYGIVGNNQWEDAWLDEGLAEYATVAFLYQKDRKFAAFLARNRLVRGISATAYADKQLSVWQRLDAFPDNQSYGDLVYSRSFSMLWLLRGAWGEERLHSFIREYAADHWHGIASGADFVEKLSEEAGEDASAFIHYWLYLDTSKRAEAEAWLERQRKSGS